MYFIKNIVHKVCLHNKVDNIYGVICGHLETTCNIILYSQCCNKTFMEKDTVKDCFLTSAFEDYILHHRRCTFFLKKTLKNNHASSKVNVDSCKSTVVSPTLLHIDLLLLTCSSSVSSRIIFQCLCCSVYHKLSSVLVNIHPSSHVKFKMLVLYHHIQAKNYTICQRTFKQVSRRHLYLLLWLTGSTAVLAFPGNTGNTTHCLFHLTRQLADPNYYHLRFSIYHKY